MVIIMKKETHSVEETIDFAKGFASTIQTGCVIVLSGDLGVGKTAFTKGLALGLGIEDVITSPTFTLLKEYEGRLDLKHIDAYRLEGIDSDALGLYDLMGEDSVVVLEWGEFLDDLSIRPDYSVQISDTGETSRLIEIKEHTYENINY